MSVFQAWESESHIVELTEWERQRKSVNIEPDIQYQLKFSNNDIGF